MKSQFKSEVFQISKITDILKNAKTVVIHNELTLEMLNKYGENLFAVEFVDDDTAIILKDTILSWKEKADMYDDLCD